ncbi:MAG: hypothetical protein WA910_12555 [Sphingopyxis granuli]
MGFHDLNARLLARYGGTVVLSRNFPGEPPVNEWDPPNPPVTVSETLGFIVTKAAVDLLAADMVLSSDLVGIMATPAGQLGKPKITDTVTAGGKEYTVLDVQPVDADPAGVIHYAIQARV